VKRILTRRQMITGASAFGGLLLSGCDATKFLPPEIRKGPVGLSDILTMGTHRLMLSSQQLVPEYSLSDISKPFPVQGTDNPEDERYQRWRHGGFRDWRLPVRGLVERPLMLSLDDIKRLPARTQITSHSCEQGWNAIAQWTGPTLAEVLRPAGVKPGAKYVLMQTVDGWYEALDMFDVAHPQTILAYGMNGKDLPLAHGAPLRLRLERHVGYRSLKFLKSIYIAESVQDFQADPNDWFYRDDWHANFHRSGEGPPRCQGSVSADWDFHWYGGV
jgi:DMSO/TMAO reductase YedYZ molybdopterin-dependent catalytic subunit